MLVMVSWSKTRLWNKRINSSLGVPDDDMNIALDFKKLCFGKDKHGLNTFQEPHHNTIEGPFTLVAAPPPFIWNPSCENRQFHQNFSNVNSELSQKGLKELPQNDLNVAKVFAGHGLGVSQLNPLGHSTGHGFGISSLSNSLNQARNYRGHHSVGSGSGRCPYANTPGAFGSPSAEVYGVFPKYHTALPRENAINRPQLLSTTQIQPPEEKTTSGVNDRTKRAPECGLEAFELAVEENWHVMMHPINPIITKFNENV